jgi:hypothetical protein
MKTRNGFVSNSSSASFVVKKADLTPFQYAVIMHHEEMGKLFAKLSGWFDDACSPEHSWSIMHDVYVGSEWSAGDAWDIIEIGDEIRGNTTMTNFDLETLFNLLDIKAEFERD